MSVTIEKCELCGVGLDADNCYGTDDFPLCRYHHEKFYDLLNFLLTPPKEKITQPELFQAGEL